MSILEMMSKFTTNLKCNHEGLVVCIYHSSITFVRICLSIAITAAFLTVIADNRGPKYAAFCRTMGWVLDIEVCAINQTSSISQCDNILPLMVPDLEVHCHGRTIAFHDKELSLEYIFLAPV
ncbi:hypothetical protein K449DRAFT_429466 [Hypoxylon sp. EC38]|nr:hypothetical protein K449DRAFT_429466 [Hypoxylon sp. EC38]